MARYSLLSPGVVGLLVDSRRLLRLGAVSVSALALGFWGDNNFKAWGGWGADFVLLRGVEFCVDALVDAPPRYVHSGLDDVRLRIRDLGWDGDSDDGTRDFSVLGWDGTGAGVAFSVTCVAGAGAGSEGTIAVLPQQPMRRNDTRIWVTMEVDLRERGHDGHPVRFEKEVFKFGLVV
jgi:hypothetical protein